MTRLLNQFFAVRVRHGGFARLLVFVACIIPVFDRLGAQTLFREGEAAPANVRSASDPSVKRSRLAPISGTNWLQSVETPSVPQSLSINLFTNLAVTGIMQSVTAPGPGREIIQGAIVGVKGGCFILAVESNVVAGTVVLPGQGFFEIQYAGNGYHRIIERDVGKMPLCGVNAATSAITGHAEESPEVALAAAGSASAETIPVVDVVVGYTPEARDGAGGDEGIHTLIDLAVAQANQIYLSSNAKLLLRLAATTKVTYDDSGVLSVDLQRLMNPTDGYLDDFLALKQQYHADLICLLVEKSDGLVGIARQTASAANACSVVQRGFAVAHYTFAHELAHNFGCQHDRPNAATPGVYSFSYGWTFVDSNDYQQYGTVMSYEGIRIPYFSDPSVKYDTFPTGVASGPHAANNALTLTLRAPTVSAFSGVPTMVAPPAIEIVSPRNGATVFLDSNVLITASVQRGTAAIAQVNFFENGAPLASSTRPPYQCVLSNPPVGPVILTAQVIDASGLPAASSPVTITSRYHAPANDNFAHRQVLNGTNIEMTVNNTGATFETGETEHGTVDSLHSIWFTWTAPASGEAVFGTSDTDATPIVAVYRGASLKTLKGVGGSVGSSLGSFQAVRGTNYQIAYDTAYGYGATTLFLQLHSGALNDDFGQAIIIGSVPFQTLADNGAATKEPGEPNHAGDPGGKSLWWKWTAPATGSVTVAVTTYYDALLGIYTGDAVSNLTGVASASVGAWPGPASDSFDVIAGQAYSIAVDGKGGQPGLFQLTVDMTAVVACNDNFANRIALSGTNVLFAGTNFAASVEPGEPAGSHTIWWTWTAPDNGELTVSANQANAWFRLFRGSELTNLADLREGNPAMCYVQAGEVCQIQMDGYEGAELAAQCSLQFSPMTWNDNFEDRFVLAGDSNIVQGTNRYASMEPGEPNPAGRGAGRTLWWSWTAPSNGVLHIQTDAQWDCGSIGVYTGTNVTELDLVGQAGAASDYQYITSPAQLDVTVIAGTAYQIQVDALAGGWGWLINDVFNLTLQFSAVPSNAFFHDRASLAGTDVTFAATNTGATGETNDPAVGGSGKPVWWTWTALQDGTVTITSTNSSINPLFAVFTGSALGALTPIVTGANSVQFFVHQGFVYQIMADGQGGASGTIEAQLEWQPVAANDDFANRFALPGSSGTAEGLSYGATVEPGEPAMGQGIPAQHTIWWTWTAPAIGEVTFAFSGSYSQNQMAVFTGSSLATAVRVGTATSGTYFNNPVTLRTIAGMPYQIAIGGAEGNLQFSYTFVAAPSNDNFTNRIVLSGLPVSGSADNTYATSEPGEPLQGDGRSVWWSWTAPQSMLVAVASDWSARIGVYTGDSLTNLILTPLFTSAGQTVFNATGGVTYQISIDSGWGNFVVSNVLLWAAPLDPPNDYFTNRAMIVGTNAVISAYNGLATSEPSEPIAPNAAGQTLWWTWTAPETGRVSIACPSYYGIFQVFTGTALTNLVPIASGVGGYWPFSFTACAGTNYQICFDTSSTGGVGSNSFTLQQSPAPPNDNFSNAIIISGSPAQTNGSNVGATREAGEPMFAGTNSQASVWWTWIAPNTREMTISAGGATGGTFSSGFSVSYGIYVGNSVSNLTAIATGHDAGEFAAVAGTRYYIALEGANGEIGDLSLLLMPDPINDNFTNRIVLSGYTTHAAGSNVGATTEPGESQHVFNPDGASVWFTWTAPAAGTVTINYSGEGFYPGVAVYTGSSVSNLSLVAYNTFFGTLSFTTDASATYQIVLAGAWGGSGNYTMDLILNAGAHNDNFGNRIVLTGTNLTILANNSTAANHSLWWEYIAPANGSVRVDYSAVTEFTPLFNLYTGANQSSLKSTPVEVISDTPQFYFNTVKGGVYQIAVAGNKGGQGDIDLQLEFEPSPVNDDFENRTPLSGDSVGVTGNNRGASEQTGEPRDDSLTGYHSVWWTWTADTNETVVLDVTGNGFSPRVAVYRGISRNRLSLVKNNAFSGHLLPSLAFSASAGVAYQIAVDSAFGEFGDITLTLNALATPPNDNFTNANTLVGTSVSIAATNLAATSEPGEPAHAGSPASHSLWWAWTPAASGTATIDTLGSSFDTVLAVYTGTKLNRLAVIAANDDIPSGGGASRVAFSAAAGTTYRIAVDGFEGASGDVQLNLNQAASPQLSMTIDPATGPHAFAMRLHGAAGSRFLIQTSTNLLDWTTISTNQLESDVLNITQPLDATSPGRFYRVIPLQ